MAFNSTRTVAENSSTCVTMNWVFEDSLSKNVCSVDAISTGDVTLGAVELEIPVVLLYGMRLCGEIEQRLFDL